MLHLISRFQWASAFAALAVAAPILIQNAAADLAVKSGEKIGFMGDSITQGGWSNPAGYVRLVMAGLAANGIEAEAIPAGISGHKSDQMLARLDKQVLEKKPQWMTLSCGVNDVWHGKFGVPLDDAMEKAGGFELRPNEQPRGTYKANISQIVDKAQAAGAQVVVLTATVIHENLESPENQKLAPYNDFLRTLAQEKKCRLADLNAAFQKRIRAENKPGQKVLTSDGVHMALEGNKLMADGILRALGATDAEMSKASAAWEKNIAEAKAAEAAKKAAQEKARADKAAAEAAAKPEGKAP